MKEITKNILKKSIDYLALARTIAADYKSPIENASLENSDKNIYNALLFLWKLAIECIKDACVREYTGVQYPTNSASDALKALFDFRNTLESSYPSPEIFLQKLLALSYQANIIETYLKAMIVPNSVTILSTACQQADGSYYETFNQLRTTLLIPEQTKLETGAAKEYLKIIETSASAVNQLKWYRFSDTSLNDKFDRDTIYLNQQGDYSFLDYLGNLVKGNVQVDDLLNGETLSKKLSDFAFQGTILKRIGDEGLHPIEFNEQVTLEQHKELVMYLSIQNHLEIIGHATKEMLCFFPDKILKNACYHPIQYALEDKKVNTTMSIRQILKLIQEERVGAVHSHKHFSPNIIVHLLNLMKSVENGITEIITANGPAINMTSYDAATIVLILQPYFQNSYTPQINQTQIITRFNQLDRVKQDWVLSKLLPGQQKVFRPTDAPLPIDAKFRVTLS